MSHFRHRVQITVFFFQILKGSIAIDDYFTDKQEDKLFGLQNKKDTNVICLFFTLKVSEGVRRA